VKENFSSHLPDRIVRAAEKMQTQLIRMQHIFSEPPITICHGDLRYDNLFFNDSGMAVADWQIILRARAPYDAAYFMSQSVNPKDRRASEMEILRTYHDVLVDAGVRDYSFDHCLEDYRFAAMYCLVYPVISAGSLDLANERGVALATAMLDRSVSTILDLDCDEKIPD
jgi:thiamine kinase-like enzyme